MSNAPLEDEGLLSATDFGEPNHLASRDPGDEPMPAESQAGSKGKGGFGRKGKARSASAASEKPSAKATTPRGRRGTHVAALTQIYGGAGIAVQMVNPVVGGAILANAHSCAVSIDQLAYENDAVRRVVVAMTNSSVAGQVMIAHLPILLAIATQAKPDLLPAGMAEMMGQTPEAQSEPETPDDGNEPQGRQTAPPKSSPSAKRKR